MSPRLLIAFASMATLAIACGSGASDESSPTAPGAPLDPKDKPPGADDPVVAEKLLEKPWEVVSNKGETYLPNVFYADASQNEQIMPVALDGHTMIDRMVYPTIGNPNLYTKGDANDQFMVVLRVEDGAYAFLSAKSPPV